MIFHAKFAVNAMREALDAYMTSGSLIQTCNYVLRNKQFLEAPGSAGKHHAYRGGLAIHTFEVMSNALLLARKEDVALGPHVDLEVLVAASIWHDFMKIEEYRWNGDEIAKTEYRNLIRHVAGSFAEFMKVSEMDSVRLEQRNMIGHAILAHHGRHEWGSPVEPQTIEAKILHEADMMSARPDFQKESN